MQITSKITNPKEQTTNYNLSERTIIFAKNILILCKNIKLTFYNKNIIDQLIRSSTSIGANYAEANDCLGKKDFIMRIRIARKEAKETIYWLELLKTDEMNPLIDSCINECGQIKKILSKIIIKIS